MDYMCKMNCVTTALPLYRPSSLRRLTLDSYSCFSCRSARVVDLNMESNYKVKVGDCIASSSSSYQVEQIVGSGAYGVVALCRNNSRGQTVALKVLKDLQHGEVGQKEASILRSLTESGSASHHIVQWLDSFEFQGLYVHEFEKLDISLLTFLSRAPFESLQLKYIRPILTQTAEALLFMKNQGLIHGDLKPENIMLTDHVHQPLRIKVIDFGLSRSVREARQGTVLGTLYYRAPELVIGSPLSAALDMWAVGCIAAEMFLGKILFWSNNNRDLIRMIVEMLGPLPEHVLDSGLFTHKYFTPEGSCYWNQMMNPEERQTPRTVESLNDIYWMDPYIQVKARTEAEDYDRIYFVDLIKRMLDLNPETRISPEEVLTHPFITLSHLTPKNFHQYASKSEKVQRQALGREPQPSTSLSSLQTPEATQRHPSVQMTFKDLWRSAAVSEKSSDLIILESGYGTGKRKRDEEELIILDSVSENRKKRRVEVINLVSGSAHSSKDHSAGGVCEASPDVVITEDSVSANRKRKREEKQEIDLDSVGEIRKKKRGIILDSISPDKKRKSEEKEQIDLDSVRETRKKKESTEITLDSLSSDRQRTSKGKAETDPDSVIETRKTKESERTILDVVSSNRKRKRPDLTSPSPKHRRYGPSHI